jgi:hypothetical protein
MKYYKNGAVYEGSVEEILQIQNQFAKQEQGLGTCKRCGGNDVKYDKLVFFNFEKSAKVFRHRCHCKTCDSWYFIPMTNESVNALKSSKWINHPSYVLAKEQGLTS